MVIQHNIPALNSHRYLGVNNSAASKNLEKLSSGFRINRAGDDAAGLAISEKMRGQIRGLGKAEENTSNAINLIQTAEGGMQELHSIVQRMREISVQSTNGTYHNQVDREALDAEFQALKEEFDRIADYTNYNGIKLLNGDPFGTSSTGTSSVGNTFSFNSFTEFDKRLTDGNTLEIDTLNDDLDWGSYNITADIRLNSDGSINLAESTVTFDDMMGGVYQGVLSLNSGDIEVVFTNPNDSTQTADFVINTSDLDLTTDYHIGISGFTFSQMSTSTGVGNANTYGSATDMSITYTDDAAALINAYRNAAAQQVANGTDIYGKVFSNAGVTVAGAPASPEETSFDYSIELFYNANGTLNMAKTNAMLQNLYNTGAIESEIALTLAGDVLTAVITEGDATFTVALTGYNADTLKQPAGAASSTLSFTVNTTGATAGTVDNLKFSANSVTTGDIASGIANPQGGDTLIFQVGANGTKDQQVYLKLNDMHAEKLGMGADFSELRDEITVFEKADGTTVKRAEFDSLNVADLNVSNVDNANVSIEVLTQALNDVSLKRAELGAVQNRLEYTLNNLGVTKENLTAAESTIRDVDMAKEMMEFTKNSILIQSSQAMLAQANTLPQGVLQLLR